MPLSLALSSVGNAQLGVAGLEQGVVLVFYSRQPSEFIQLRLIILRLGELVLPLPVHQLEVLFGLDALAEFLGFLVVEVPLAAELRLVPSVFPKRLPQLQRLLHRGGEKVVLVRRLVLFVAEAQDFAVDYTSGVVAVVFLQLNKILLMLLHLLLILNSPLLRLQSRLPRTLYPVFFQLAS